MEIIRMVEESPFSVKQTLLEIGVSRSTFYEWYKRYQEQGHEGLRSHYKSPRQIWNKIPEWEKQRVLDVARQYPEKSSRELACHITDKMDYFISESSVYRILKAYDLVTSPVYTVISAKDKFEHPTTRINQLWQTDFSYLKVIDWGWYYLSTAMSMWFIVPGFSVIMAQLMSQRNSDAISQLMRSTTSGPSLITQ